MVWEYTFTLVLNGSLLLYYPLGTESEIVIRAYKMINNTGFAPNPFHGYLTSATCKPGIRRVAEVGEWICGFDSKELSGNPPGKEKLVYVMKVEEKLTFDRYYEDPRFQHKKPRPGKGPTYKVSDNIYHKETKVGESCDHCKLEDQIADLIPQILLIRRMHMMENLRNVTSLRRALVIQEGIAEGSFTGLGELSGSYLCSCSEDK